MSFSDYLEPERLKETFDKKLINSFTLGTDGITVKKFSQDLEEEIAIINRKVKNSTYKFSRYKEKLILKGKNKLPRIIQIPTHRDKLLLNALKEFLVDNFKDKNNDTSLHQKISSIKEHLELKKYDSFIKIDIENFFPSIDHKILLEKISNVVDDKHAMEILKKAIECNDIGVPQGLSISNVLSSIYLQELDSIYNLKRDIVYYRYIDDILILCNKKDIDKTIKSLKKDLKKIKLSLHSFDDTSDKSLVGDIYNDSFRYLGYEFTKSKITVRQNSVTKLQDRILAVFNQNKNSTDHELYRAINLKVTGCIYDDKQYGWLHFFGLIDDLELLHQLDWFIKKCFKQFNRRYDETKIKKFVKAYFELKNLDAQKLHNDSYIPKFSGNNNFNQPKNALIKELNLDVGSY